MVVNMKSFLEIKVKWRNLMSVCLGSILLGGPPTIISLLCSPNQPPTSHNELCTMLSSFVFCAFVGGLKLNPMPSVEVLRGGRQMSYPPPSNNTRTTCKEEEEQRPPSRTAKSEEPGVLSDFVNRGERKSNRDMECQERKLGRRKLYFNGQDLDFVH